MISKVLLCNSIEGDNALVLKHWDNRLGTPNDSFKVFSCKAEARMDDGTDVSCTCLMESKYNSVLFSCIDELSNDMLECIVKAIKLRCSGSVRI